MRRSPVRYLKSFVFDRYRLPEQEDARRIRQESLHWVECGGTERRFDRQDSVTSCYRPTGVEHIDEHRTKNGQAEPVCHSDRECAVHFHRLPSSVALRIHYLETSTHRNNTVPSR